MAENGDGGRGVGMKEMGRQQIGQEFHWGPQVWDSGTRGLIHGTAVTPQEREGGDRDKDSTGSPGPHGAGRHMHR